MQIQKRTEWESLAECDGQFVRRHIQEKDFPAKTAIMLKDEKEFNSILKTDLKMKSLFKLVTEVCGDGTKNRKKIRA
jgi:hypothetical protein